MKNLIKIIIAVGIFFAFSLISDASANSFCANGTSMTREEFQRVRATRALFASFTFQNNQVIVHINNSTGCTAPLIGSTYKVFVAQGAGFLSTQEFIADSGVVNIKTNGVTDIVLPRASCRTQADVWYQTAPRVLQDGQTYTGYSFPSILEGQVSTDPLCTNQTALVVSCSANPSSANVNNSINWTATATGGTGSYTYSWSGTDGLSGNSQSISKYYSGSGSKQASVLVTSGNLSASATCYTDIYAVQSYYQYQDSILGGTCTANVYNTQTGNNVTWSANAYGGNNYYTYYWNGSDGLYGSGQYTYKTYNNPGQKYANVTITSGGQSITRSCEVNVGQVLSYVQTTQLPTLSSVYLSDLPYTGIEDYKMPLFVAGLSLWSLIVSMIIYKRRNSKWSSY